MKPLIRRMDLFVSAKPALQVFLLRNRFNMAVGQDNALARDAAVATGSGIVFEAGEFVDPSDVEFLS